MDRLTICVIVISSTALTLAVLSRFRIRGDELRRDIEACSEEIQDVRKYLRREGIH